MSEQFTDEYFINLTMDFDHRDDEIYPKWAVWCAKSNDRYFIDGRNHQFYTHVRTDEEIAIERKKREIMEFCMNERMKLEDAESSEEEKAEFQEYERYIHEAIFINENILEFNPKTFVEWKKEK